MDNRIRLKDRNTKQTSRDKRLRVPMGFGIRNSKAERKRGDSMKHTTWGNPYTHTEYSRTTYGKQDLLYGYGVCDWCGNVKHTLYRYNDGAPIQLMGQKVKLYCNKSCYEANEI